MNSTTPKNDTQGMNIQSITRALNILKFIASSGNSATLGAISEGVGLGTSTTHNILRTLKQGDFVLQYEAGGPYSIGFAVLNLARSVEHSTSLSTIANGTMEKLSQKYNESVNLSAFIDGYSVYIGGVECTHDVRIMNYIGKRNLVHITGAGKVLLAGQKDSVIDAFLENADLVQKTPLTITSPEGLRIVLKRIRDQGYGLDEGEYQESIWCAAAPIYNSHGNVLAALSISFPANRINNFNKDLVIDDVIASAAEISRLMGFEKQKN